MPELPEVETIVQVLRPYVQEKELLGVEVHDPALGQAGALLKLPARLRALRRRGKYILFHLEDQTLVVHLRMSGRLVWEENPSARGNAPFLGRVRLALHFSTGTIYLVDPRRLGQVKVVDQFTDELGPEPFGDLSWLSSALQKSRMPIKGWLLDQRRIAGIGNIYAAEILFRAGIDPRRPANSLSQEEVNRLDFSITTVLSEAIAAMGTTLRDRAYLGPEGERGEFGFRLSVYGRVGKPCPICGNEIRKVKIGGRSTYFCSTCQR